MSFLFFLDTLIFCYWQKSKNTAPAAITLSAKTVLFYAPSGVRTLDTLIKSQVLYQLS